MVSAADLFTYKHLVNHPTLGDMIRVNTMGQDIIVINSLEVATSLLHQRGQVYSGRPRLTFIGDLAGWQELTPLLQDGPELRERRRLFAQELGTKAALERYTPIIETKARNFIRAVLNEPSAGELVRHIRT
jgi:cytochrome P450